MKHIKKSEEPQEFKDWKQQQKSTGINYNYESFQNPEKRLVHSALLSEQGYICCYCCQKIEKETSHIEHFSPQSKTDAELSVTYSNLLASCGSSQHRLNIVVIKGKIIRFPSHPYKLTVKSILDILERVKLFLLII